MQACPSTLCGAGRLHLYAAPDSRHAGDETLVLLLEQTVMVHADAFDDGLAAYQRGDFPAALNFWKPLAEQGHADAQYNVALIYYAGEGVPRDDAEGAKWLRMAAEQGVANAQNNLGVMYAEGRGLPEDNAEAVKWFRKAADQGYA